MYKQIMKFQCHDIQNNKKHLNEISNESVSIGLFAHTES